MGMEERGMLEATVRKETAADRREEPPENKEAYKPPKKYDGKTIAEHYPVPTTALEIMLYMNMAGGM
jgi:hypothetical protein